MLNYQTLCSFHETFLGYPPNEDQQLLYKVYPDIRGYSGHEINVDRFEVSFMLALFQTFPFDSNLCRRSMFFVAARNRKWADEQTNRIIHVIFDLLKEKQAARVAQFLGSAFNHMIMDKCSPCIERPPDRWASFGFHKIDPIPEWMQKALLDG